ncbi:MAG: hypothetical protein OER95_08875 [Acidimicrobiia bacterium]|nr:hypothetical protein [Acidimicrobiia bacterium]
MRSRFVVALFAALILALLPAAPASAQPPGNDAFDGAISVSGLPFEDLVDVAEATIEDGEPIETCAPFANTVWYSLTLDTATDVVVDTAGSDYDTTIAVWTGDSLGDLANVTCVDDTFNSLQAAASFSAEPGQTYRIQVGAFGEAVEGTTLQLSIDEASRPTGRPDIFKSSSRGVGASAFAEEFDEENGTFSFTDVFVSQSRQKFFQGRPFQSSTLFVSHFEESYNPETGEFSFVDLFGFTDLAPGQFDVNRQLRSGFVDAEVTLSGFSCTEGPYEPNGEGFEFQTSCTEIGPEPVSVNVVWAGQGPTFRSRFSERFSTEGTRFSFRGTSTSREATVTGSVQGETIFFDLDGAFGNLSRESFADMVVVRGGMFIF